MVNSKDRVGAGVLKDFIARKFDSAKSYKERGTISKEAERLFKLAKGEGIQTSKNSIAQAIGKLSKTGGKTHHIPTRNVNDDFEQLDVLISDAIAAMKLVQEHLPKVRKETERLRGMKDRVLKLFSE